MAWPDWFAVRWMMIRFLAISMSSSTALPTA
jgi:hypothetical protein